MLPVLVVAFIVVPLAEIYVIVQVGSAIGALRTIALLLACSLIGAWLVRREGIRAWRAVAAALAAGRMPGREMVDGVLVLAGGVLLLTPGFITDSAGFLLVIPPTRALARQAAGRFLSRRARQW